MSIIIIIIIVVVMIAAQTVETHLLPVSTTDDIPDRSNPLEA